MRLRTILFAALIVPAFGHTLLESYNLVWKSPSKDSSGSMPLGNGDLGINLWVEESGDVVFYLAKSDAWDDNARQVKLGRVRLRLNPNPFAGGQRFKQRLNLRTGDITIEGGQQDASAKLTIWVDAYHPVVNIEAETLRETEIQASYERWRDQTRVLDGDEVESAYGLVGGPEPIRVYGDSIARDSETTVVWYHRNIKSSWPSMLKLQGLTELNLTLPDPLRDRTFGAGIQGEGFSMVNPTTLRSNVPAQKQILQVVALTKQSDSPEEWIRDLRHLMSQNLTSRRQDRRVAHQKYWQDFWDRSYIRVHGSPDARDVTQAYLLQRFVTACAGRGAYPIQPNGSLFTMDAKVGGLQYDADYRKAGGPYRLHPMNLVYWPLLASGDSELMQPLFKMFREALLFATQRTRVYFNHDGAFFPESMYFWGGYPNSDYGWNREGTTPAYIDNAAIRNNFASNLELLALLLDYTDYFPQDRTFRAMYLTPIAGAVVQFYDLHFGRGSDGYLRLAPSQVLDTWLEARNPLPDIAGLKYVLSRLQTEKAPLSRPTQAAMRRLLAYLPNLPERYIGGRRTLAPAEEVSGDAKNDQNPELYAIFPFRLYGVDKPGIELARNTFNLRRVKAVGETSLDAVQAAYLGNANAARQYLLDRLAEKNDYRFPVFQSANSAWTPDQANGSTAAIALQSMLLQADGTRILIAPAWPKDWDCEFRLYAPDSTLVEGAIKGGKVEWLRTTPERRMADITRFDPK